MFRFKMMIPAVVLLAGMGFTPSQAQAQDCGPAGCGPMVGGCTGLDCVGNGTAFFSRDRRTFLRRPDGNQPACATRTYPLSDWAYIRKYCGPSLIPGTCYGHFQTKWRRWEEACPQSAVAMDPCPPGGFPGAISTMPQGTMPQGPMMPPMAAPLPATPPATAPGQLLPIPQPGPSKAPEKLDAPSTLAVPKLNTPPSE